MDGCGNVSGGPKHPQIRTTCCARCSEFLLQFPPIAPISHPLIRLPMLSFSDRFLFCRWLNLHTPSYERFARQSATCVFSALLILFSFGVLYGAQLLQSQGSALADNNEASTGLCVAIADGVAAAGSGSYGSNTAVTSVTTGRMFSYGPARDSGVALAPQLSSLLTSTSTSSGGSSGRSLIESTLAGDGVYLPVDINTAYQYNLMGLDTSSSSSAAFSNATSLSDASSCSHRLSGLLHINTTAYLMSLAPLVSAEQALLLAAASNGSNTSVVRYTGYGPNGTTACPSSYSTGGGAAMLAMSLRRPYNASYYSPVTVVQELSCGAYCGANGSAAAVALLLQAATSSTTSSSAGARAATSAPLLVPPTDSMRSCYCRSVLFTRPASLLPSSGTLYSLGNRVLNSVLGADSGGGSGGGGGAILSTASSSGTWGSGSSGNASSSSGPLSYWWGGYASDGYPLLDVATSSTNANASLSILLDGGLVSTQTFDAAPSAVADFEVCADWLASYALYTGLIGFAAFIVVATNTAMASCIRKTADFDRPLSYEGERVSLLLRMVSLQFFNTGLLTLLVSAYIPALALDAQVNLYDDFTAEWYSAKGTAIMLTMMLQAVMPHAQSLLAYYAWKMRRSAVVRYCCCCCCRVGGGAKTQSALNKFYLGPEFDPTWRYSQHLTMTFVCLFYSTGIPAMVLIAAVSFILSYIVDFWLFIGWYKRPVKEDTRVGETSLSLIPIALLLHLLIGGWMMSGNMVYAASGGGTTVGGYGIVPGTDQLLSWWYSGSGSSGSGGGAGGDSVHLPAPYPPSNCSITPTPPVFYYRLVGRYYDVSPALNGSATMTWRSNFSIAELQLQPFWGAVNSTNSSNATTTTLLYWNSTVCDEAGYNWTISDATSNSGSSGGGHRRRARLLALTGIDIPSLPDRAASYFNSAAASAASIAAGLRSYAGDMSDQIVERFDTPYVLPYGIFALMWFIIIVGSLLLTYLLKPVYKTLSAYLCCCRGVGGRVIAAARIAWWNPGDGVCWKMSAACCCCCARRGTGGGGGSGTRGGGGSSRPASGAPVPTGSVAATRPTNGDRKQQQQTQVKDTSATTSSSSSSSKASAKSKGGKEKQQQHGKWGKKQAKGGDPSSSSSYSWLTSFGWRSRSPAPAAGANADVVEAGDDDDAAVEAQAPLPPPPRVPVSVLIRRLTDIGHGPAPKGTATAQLSSSSTALIAQPAATTTITGNSNTAGGSSVGQGAPGDGAADIPFIDGAAPINPRVGGDLASFTPPLKWMSIIAVRRIEDGRVPPIGEVIRALMMEAGADSASSSSSTKRGDGAAAAALNLAGAAGVDLAAAEAAYQCQAEDDDAAERRRRRSGCLSCCARTWCCACLCTYHAMCGGAAGDDDRGDSNDRRGGSSGKGSKGKAKGNNKEKQVKGSKRGNDKGGSSKNGNSSKAEPKGKGKGGSKDAVVIGGRSGGSKPQAAASGAHSQGGKAASDTSLTTPASRSSSGRAGCCRRPLRVFCCGGYVTIGLPRRLAALLPCCRRRPSSVGGDDADGWHAEFAGHRPGDVSEDGRFMLATPPSYATALALRMLSGVSTYSVLTNPRVMAALFPHVSDPARLAGRYNSIASAALFEGLDLGKEDALVAKYGSWEEEEAEHVTVDEDGGGGSAEGAGTTGAAGTAGGDSDDDGARGAAPSTQQHGGTRKRKPAAR